MGSFGEGLERFQRNRRVWQTRRATPVLAREAVPGTWVTVLGVVEAEMVLRAPITQASAVAYAARVEEHVFVPGDDKPFGRPTGHDSKLTSFRVVDAEGRTMRVEESPFVLGDELVDVAPRLGLTAIDGDLTALAGAPVHDTKGRNFLELRIAAGERVRVTGFVGESADVVSTGYRDAAGTMKTLRGTEDEPLVVVKA